MDALSCTGKFIQVTTEETFLCHEVLQLQTHDEDLDTKALDVTFYDSNSACWLTLEVIFTSGNAVYIP